MKKQLLIAFLVLVLLAAGCGKKLSVTIEEEPKITIPETPICNLDGKCDAVEECECNDCKETFECRKLALGENEYLLKKEMSDKVAGKTVTFVNLDSSGKTTMRVDSVTRVIEKTKLREIINGLEVTVLETEYDVSPGKIIIKLLVKEYKPEEGEHFFEKVGSEKIIESVRIRLNRVEASVPRNFVRLDVGNKLNEKVSEGETKTIEGLSITLLEAHPRGIPTESYAILKVQKI